MSHRADGVVRPIGRWRGLIAAGLLAGCTALSATSVRIPPVAVADARAAPRPLPAMLALPDGPGPHPAVIVLHGCGGIRPPLMAWADRLNSWGYAALLVDSFAPRGVSTVCADQSVTPADRAGDVLAAAQFLAGLPTIDGARIGVLGFSHGGSTAAVVTETRFSDLQPGLIKAAVDYYGGCGSAERHGTVPLLALKGDADDWPPLAPCLAFRDRLRPDQPFELVSYRGVFHAFDVPGTYTLNLGHRLAYDEAAASDSFVRTRAFLDRWLRQR